MLARIHIQNYALIAHLDLDFSSGFTAITGETGSGKSILLGALSLVLGERADTHVLFEKDKKCIVEVDFDISKLALKSFFETHDLDFLPTCTLRREISTSGRSRAFINDSPVQLTIMKSLATRLVDLHSQHQTLLLRDDHFQLVLLDIFAKHGSDLNKYQAVYHDYLAKKEELKELGRYIREHKIDKDYLEFQLQELNEVVLESGAEEGMSEELAVIDNAQEIQSTLYYATQALGQENGVLNSLSSVSQKFNNLASHSSLLAELAQRIESVRLELDDILASSEDLSQQVEADPERKAQLEEQLDSLQRLFNKHRVSNVAGLIQLKADIESRLVKADSAQRKMNSLDAELKEAHELLKTKASVLTSNRQKAKAKFIKQVSSQFSSLSMRNARLDLDLSPSADFGPLGADEVRILFSANKGGSLELLQKVASGGELSRLMLVLKKELAQAQQLATLLFDEIDTGVSGEIASQMAETLRTLSEERQVITITHLPQVAARAHQHLKISKSDNSTRSITDVKALDNEGRILELAKMLSGTRVSDASVKNARELLMG